MWFRTNFSSHVIFSKTLVSISDNKKKNVYFTALLLCKFALITHDATMSVSPSIAFSKLKKKLFIHDI